MKLTKKQVIARIRARGRGLVFTPKLFTAVSDDARAVASVLSRLAKKGSIRQLAHGLYDLPRKHPKLGALMPSVDEVVRAVQESDANTVQPTGANAANLLGLSTQVPMRVERYTNGPRKVNRYGRQQNPTEAHYLAQHGRSKYMRNCIWSSDVRSLSISCTRTKS